MLITLLIMMNLMIIVAVISESDNIRQLEAVNVNIRIGITGMKAIVDSESVCNIINRSHANAIVLNSQKKLLGKVSGKPKPRAKDFLQWIIQDYRCN